MIAPQIPTHGPQHTQFRLSTGCISVYPDNIIAYLRVDDIIKIFISILVTNKYKVKLIDNIYLEKY